MRVLLLAYDGFFMQLSASRDKVHFATMLGANHSL